MALGAEAQRRILALLAQRWAALASIGPEGPECSWVALAPEPGFQGVLLHLSDLAPHSRNLRREPKISIALSEAERPGEDPQTLARITLLGEAQEIPRASADYVTAAQCYQRRLPDSQQLFSFSDFRLFRMRPLEARFIGGFAQAHRLDASALQALAACVD